MKAIKKEKDKDKEKDASNQEDKRAEKINEGDNYLSYNILKEIIKETNIPKKIIEERNSELFYETLTGKGDITFINNTKYSGYMKNGLLESGPNKEICEILFEDGTRYEGEIHQNKITGEGKYYFPSGATYEGTLLNGLRHGSGKYVSPEGITYEGEWKYGLKDGKGIMKRGDMTYEGEWKGGRIYGQGKIKWENGNMYEGQFKMNHINGDGYMVWYDLQEKYIGKWENDKQNGLGMHIWYEPKGELKEMRNRYVGEWEDGIREGYGVFFYSNGAMYEGEWKNNMKHGFGIMRFEDGKKYIGRFEEDRILDKENQLSSEMVDKLLEEYKLNKSKVKKEELNEGENKINNINNINNIYQIVQMKNNEKNEINNSPKKKETKKLKSIGNRRNSASNISNNTNQNFNININNNNIKEQNNNNNNENKTQNNNNDNLALNTNRSKEKNQGKDTSKIVEEKVQKSPIKNPTLRSINSVSNMKKQSNNNANLMGVKFSPIDPVLKAKLNQIKVPHFIPIFDLSDLIREDSSITSDLDEISKVILRNLTYLKTIYRYLNKISKAELINEETNSSKLIIRDDLKTIEQNTISSSKRKPNLLNRSSLKRLGKQTTNPTILSVNVQKKNKIEDNIRSDELSFGISMLDVWLFLRDGGILNENASICEFDRLFALGNSTITETYLVPEDINQPKDIYEYIYNKIKETKNNFIYKYNKYFEYYYRDSKIPKSMRLSLAKEDNNDKDKDNNNDKNNNNNKIFSMEHMHDKRRIITPRMFQESIIRASQLFYSTSKNLEERNMKLSKKLTTLLNILIPPGVKKRGIGATRVSHSKLEQSFNTSVAVIENRNKLQDYHIIAEFMSLFFTDLKNMFNKLHLVTNINKPKIGDKTIFYRDFYNKVILYKSEDDSDKEAENLIKTIVPNKLEFIELITSSFKEKTNINSEENKNDCVKLYDYVNNLFYREMIEYEFNELIFLLCKKYFNIKNLKGTYKEYKEVVTAVNNIISKLEKPKNNRKKYFYPELKSHIIKQRLIDEEIARIEEEKRRKRERERYIRERELMDKEEKENAFNDKDLSEEEFSEDDVDEDDLL